MVSRGTDVVVTDMAEWVNRPQARSRVVVNGQAQDIDSKTPNTLTVYSNALGLTRSCGQLGSGRQATRSMIGSAVAS